MKIDKDDLLLGGIVGGLVICSPFIAMYHIGKWIYSKTPKKIKEQKAEEKKREEMNREIHELEKQLGLAERVILCTSAIHRKVGKVIGRI